MNRLSAWFREFRLPALFLCAVLVTVAVYFAWPYPQGYLEGRNLQSTKIFDRKGRLLAEFLPGISGFSRPVGREGLPVDLEKLLVYSEDRDFYRHHGVSPRAMARALYQNIRRFRIVSGGSTITQQLAKSLGGRTKNGWFSKFLELFQALKLEMHYSKDSILLAYVNRVYMGNRIYGMEKASEVYFGKELSSLNLLECSALICILRAPSRNNPYANPERISELAHAFLKTAASDPGASGIRTGAEDEALYRELRLAFVRSKPEILAPHFCFYVLEEARKIAGPGRPAVRIDTTLDLDLYELFSKSSKNRLSILKDQGALHTGVLMIDNRSMEIRVMLGSVDFFGEKGQINAALIRRPAASTMKPFTYALALDSGKFNASSILPDIYASYDAPVGKFVPRNYNERYHGPVRLGVALGSSFNVPAVYLLDKIGIYPLYRLLKSAGFDSIDRQPSFYGLGLTLGNADVTLLELVNAYTLFANAGSFRKASCITRVETENGEVIEPEPRETRQLIRPETAWLVTHLLSDYQYKEPGFGSHSPIRFPFPVAVKTGTSKDYKDNFVAAFTPRFTVGVWVGNLFNQPMEQLPSSLGGGIILRDLLLDLYNSGYPFPEFDPHPGSVVETEVCRLSGMRAGPWCGSVMKEYFLENAVPDDDCTWHTARGTILPEIYREWAQQGPLNETPAMRSEEELRIVYPADGDIFQVAKFIGVQNQKVPLRAVSRSASVDWYLDGGKIGSGKEIFWKPSAGTHVLEIRDGKGNRDRIQIIVTEERGAD